MVNREILFPKALSHNNERCDVYYAETDNFSEIPDNLKLKAHAVCFYDGKMLLVNHITWNLWGIPGGSREPEETIEATLEREILEESNCKVETCAPIAYHRVVHPDGEMHYRLKYICNVIPIGRFTADPAGHIAKTTWINPVDFEKYLEQKEHYIVFVRKAVELMAK